MKGLASRFGFKPTALAVVAAVGVTGAFSTGVAGASSGSISSDVQAAASVSALAKKYANTYAKKYAKKYAKAGPQGPAGPAGPTGPTGPAGPSNLAKFACKENQGQNDSGCGTIYNQNGVRLQADCTTNGLTVRSTVAGGVMTLYGLSSNGNTLAAATANSAVNDGVILTPAAGALGSGGVVSWTPPNSTTVVTINFSAVVSAGAPQGDCVYYGTVLTQ